MSLAVLLGDVLNAALAGGRTTLDEIVDLAWREHGAQLGAELAAEQDQLDRRYVRSQFRRLLKARLSDDDQDEQLSIPGLHLPSAIAVRDDDGGVYYVAADQATWGELLAGLEEREQHIAYVTARRDLYLRSLEQLRRSWSPTRG